MGEGLHGGGVELGEEKVKSVKNIFTLKIEAYWRRQLALHHNFIIYYNLLKNSWNSRIFHHSNLIRKIRFCLRTAAVCFAFAQTLIFNGGYSQAHAVRCAFAQTLDCMRMPTLIWQSTDRSFPLQVPPRNKSG